MSGSFETLGHSASLLRMSGAEGPSAAAATWPYPGHRTMAAVIADEASFDKLRTSGPPRRWCPTCRQDVTFETASACRAALCPKGRG